MESEQVVPNRLVAMREKLVFYARNIRNRRRTAFLVGCFAHIHHFEKIYRFMPKKTFCLLIVANENQYRNFSTETIGYSKKNKINYVVFDPETIHDFYFKNLVQMTPSYSGKRIANTYVRYMINGYEIHFDNLNRECDIFLCQGERNEKLLKKINVNDQALYVKGGYARLQDFAPKNNVNITGAYRKKIVYMPTHGSGGTLSSYKDVLMRLARSYDVICKPHPDSIEKFAGDSEYEVLEELSCNGVTVIKESLHKESLHSEDWLNDADLFVADFGGSTLLGLYFGKPTLLLNPPEEEYHFSFLSQNFPVDIEPMEIYLRKFYPTVSFKDKFSVDSAMIDDIISTYKSENYQRLRQEFFYSNKEPAGKIFASALLTQS